MTELANRRLATDQKYVELRAHLATVDQIVSQKACVYATGSYGRGEAGSKSDLDLFIVGLDKKNDKGEIIGSALNNLDAICVKSALITATRALGIPDFDGDGKYLAHFHVNELVENLGTPKDDFTNTFAARLLLLLESTPIIEVGVYNQVISDVVARYWRDYQDHAADFIPAFIVNDVLRLWRTFCVNYEASTQADSELIKAKRKTKNYKLKHSRLLTCFSALLYLLAIYDEHGTVEPKFVIDMIGLTPTQRLEWLLRRASAANIHDKIRLLLEQYNKFLEKTSVGDKALIDSFRDKASAQSYMSDAFHFGDTMSEALSMLGRVVA